MSFEYELSSIDTQAHSIAPTFTRCQVDRSELQLNMPSSSPAPASDKGCRIDRAMHLAVIDVCISQHPSVLCCSRQELALHIGSAEGDFFGLPDGHFVRAAFSSTSVGWKFLRKPGNFCGLEVDGNLVINHEL